MERKKQKQLLYGSIAAFGLSAASILLFPADLFWKVPGILFWVGMIAGCVLQYLLSRTRKKDGRRARRPGVLRFFSNPGAAIADAAFLPAVIAFAITARRTHAVGYLGYVFLAAALFALYMHCVLNGRAYEDIHKKQRVRKENTVREEERTNEE